MIDCLARKCDLSSEAPRIRINMCAVIDDFRVASRLPCALAEVAPSDENLWHGFMMMVSFSMLNFEDKATDADLEVLPLIRAFLEDDKYARHTHGFAWLLFGTLSEEVCDEVCIIVL